MFVADDQSEQSADDLTSASQSKHNDDDKLLKADNQNTTGKC